MLLALFELRCYGVVHSDVKPSNILLEEDDRYILADFNAAVPHKSTVKETSRSTPFYCRYSILTSPEYIDGGKLTSRSDLWSLGIIAYEMATFKHPFEADTVNKLYDSIMNKDYTSLPGSYSSNLSNIIGSLLRKNAKNRPSIEDLLYYDDTIVKAGVTVLGHEIYKKLIAAKKRIINEYDWFKSIKNGKFLGSFMQNFAGMYKPTPVPKDMIHSIADIPTTHPRIRAEDIIDYDEPVQKYKPILEGTETGDLRKRLEANRLRVNENQLNQAKVSRITKKKTEEQKAEVSKKPIDTFSKDTPAKFLKDYDLDNYYKAAHPQGNLPKVTPNTHLPEIPVLELSED